MIFINLSSLLEKKGRLEKRRIQLIEVSEETGISRATLTRIINQPGYSTNLETIDSLCEYFECEPGDLLEYEPNAKDSDSSS